jgi:hypothetical protein
MSGVRLAFRIPCANRRNGVKAQISVALVTEQAHTEIVFSVVCSHSLDHASSEAEEKNPGLG